MLNTIIDYSVFDHFIKSQPAQIPIGSQEDNDVWNSLWNYLKQGSNVVLTNYQNQQNIFLNNLTTGRKGTTFKPETTFKKPKNCKLPKGQNIQTVFFLNEPLDSEKEKYRKKNAFIFGFVDDYPKVWKEISFIGKENVLHDRKSVNDDKRFTWDKFSEFILPFTDVIVRDDFLFKDIDEIENRFISIINALSNASSNKFKILVIVNKFKMDRKFKKNLNELYQYIEKQQLLNSSIDSIGFIHTAKEHDRYIFFNYLEVDFGKIPDTSNAPTKISFHPYTIHNCYSDAKIILDDIKVIVNNSIKNQDFAGNCDNRLLK